VEIAFAIQSATIDPVHVQQLVDNVETAADDGAMVANIQKKALEYGVLTLALKEMNRTVEISAPAPAERATVGFELTSTPAASNPAAASDPAAEPSPMPATAEGAQAALLEELADQEEAEEAAGAVGGAVSTVVVGAVAGAAAGAAGGAAAGAAGGAAGGAGGGGGGGGGGGAVVLIFALQKLSSVTSSSNMKDKLPVVSGLGESFQWANLQFALGGSSNSSEQGGGNTSVWGSNTTVANAVTSGGRRLAQGLMNAPAAISSSVHHGMHSLRKGANGAHTLARIGTKQYLRWDEKRIARNETIGAVIGATATATARHLLQMATASSVAGPTTMSHARRRQLARARRSKGRFSGDADNDTAFDVCSPFGADPFGAEANTTNTSGYGTEATEADGEEVVVVVEEEEEEDGDAGGDGVLKTIEGDPLAVADLSAEDALSAKFEGNLILSCAVLAFLSTCHVIAENVKLGPIATFILKANPFPKPELFFVMVIYQGCCMSASTLMIKTGDPVKSTLASLIFMAIPLGFFLLACWHCIYQVWWLGRAEYYIPPEPAPTPDSPQEADDIDKHIPGNPTTEVNLPMQIASLDVDRILLEEKQDRIGGGVTGVEDAPLHNVILNKAKPLSLLDVSTALETCALDTEVIAGESQVEMEKLTYVEVVDEGKEAVVVAADGHPGNWSTLLVKTCETGETRRLSAEQVRHVPGLKRRHHRKRLKEQEQQEQQEQQEEIAETRLNDYVFANVQQQVSAAPTAPLPPPTPTAPLPPPTPTSPLPPLPSTPLPQPDTENGLNNFMFSSIHKQVSAGHVMVVDHFEDTACSEEQQKRVETEHEEVSAAIDQDKSPAMGGSGLYEEQSALRPHNRRQDLVVRYFQEVADNLDEQLDNYHDGNGSGPGSKQMQKGTGSEEREEEEEEEEEEQEEGWIDAFDDDDDYVDIYGTLFDFAKSRRTAAIFGPLEVLRMLIVGVCTSLLVHDYQAMTQANTILGIHALQFALELIIPPEPEAWDRLLDTFAMLTDLVPLIISILPAELFREDGCGGAMPIGVQMLVMGAALLATGQRIIVLFTDLLPQVFDLLKTIVLIVIKILCICAPVVHKPAKKHKVASADECLGKETKEGSTGQQGNEEGATVYRVTYWDSFNEE
jgi:hypothetical protein